LGKFGKAHAGVVDSEKRRQLSPDFSKPEVGAVVDQLEEPQILGPRQ
jgi:hypothetical protein